MRRWFAVLTAVLLTGRIACASAKAVRRTGTVTLRLIRVPDVPKTADSTNILLWAGMILLGIAGIGMFVLAKHRD